MWDFLLMDRNKWTANYHFSQGILQAGWNGFHQKLKAFGLLSRHCSRTLYQFYLKPDRHSETASVFNSSNDLCASCLEFFKSNHPRSYFLGGYQVWSLPGPSLLIQVYLRQKVSQFILFSVFVPLGIWLSWETVLLVWGPGGAG